MSSGVKQPRPRGRASGNGAPPPPYRLYRSHPRSLLAFLRGEEDVLAPEREDRPARRIGTGRRFTWKKGVLVVLAAIAGWLLLSLALFLISSAQEAGIPASAQAELSPGGNMLTSANTILILGTDQRPPGSKEPGANTNDAGSRSDSIMLWRVGGGTSQRLSIPRDTAVSIPGYGTNKINAAYAFGGPALALKTVEQFTGLKINHLIIVNLAAFPKFIDALGGIDVTTGRVCSVISGGPANGGWALNLSPGTHHLNGTQALVYARTRENRCNPSDNDLTREAWQQQILNAVKAKLSSPLTFFHLPWASWYAPKTLRTDMGGFTLLSLFAAAEIGGSAPVQVLKPTGAEVLANGGDALTVTPGAVQSAVAKLMGG